MFKNRTMQVKFTKDKDLPNDNYDTMPVDPAEIAEIITENTIKAVAVIGGVVAANRVLKTICEIAVVAAKAKIK
jgi:predicted CoA-binding protein